MKPVYFLALATILSTLFYIQDKQAKKKSRRAREERKATNKKLMDDNRPYLLQLEKQVDSLLLGTENIAADKSEQPKNIQHMLVGMMNEQPFKDSSFNDLSKKNSISLTIEDYVSEDGNVKKKGIADNSSGSSAFGIFAKLHEEGNTEPGYQDKELIEALKKVKYLVVYDEIYGRTPRMSGDESFESGVTVKKASIYALDGRKKETKYITAFSSEQVRTVKSKYSEAMGGKSGSFELRFDLTRNFNKKADSVLFRNDPVIGF